MYDTHRLRQGADSISWAILSPHVPVFREDDGRKLEEPWLMSFNSSAPPVAHYVGFHASARFMDDRIRRILDIAAAYGDDALGYSGEYVARSFIETLTADGRPRFRRVIFAIADWSEDRRMLGPFRDAIRRL
jgi:uncharacterized protein (TIGR02452 family)